MCDKIALQHAASHEPCLSCQAHFLRYASCIRTCAPALCLITTFVEGADNGENRSKSDAESKSDIVTAI